MPPRSLRARVRHAAAHLAAFPAFVFLVWVVASSGGCAGRQDVAQPRPDYLAPLVLPKVGPVPYEHASLYGQPVIVNFFATWCFPCLGQLPFLAELQQAHAQDGLRVVAVGMDLEGAKVLRPFAEQFGMPYPILVASERLHRGETPYGLMRELPSTVILGRDGQVIAAWAGIAEADEVREAVARALRSRR